MSRTLVTGGVRSGKSVVAQKIVGELGPAVTYIAAGPKYDDADWRRRIAAHRGNRPATWRTVEPGCRELPGLLLSSDRPVIVECLGTWLTALLDDVGAWTSIADPVIGSQAWRPQAALVQDELLNAVERCRVPIVLVTNEVGWGLVSEHRSGRVFADELGRLNQRVAGVCDQVVLVACGIPLTIKTPQRTER